MSPKYRYYPLILVCIKLLHQFLGVPASWLYFQHNPQRSQRCSYYLNQCLSFQNFHPLNLGEIKHLLYTSHILDSGVSGKIRYNLYPQGTKSPLREAHILHESSFGYK
jgi:hypothetical protein